jgi:hypothetical protein
MSTPHETSARGALPPLRTLGDVRAALRAGHGFPGDREDFEKDLERALEASSETDLRAVAEVITDYRGRIRLHSDPEYEIGMQEAEEALARVKREGV